MAKKLSRNQERVRRHVRVRRKVNGTTERPRLSVYRSNGNISVQIIDDITKVTLVSTGSIALKLENGGNVAAASAVGAEIAKLAQDKGIKSVVFHRGGYIYHGRVKALAESAREAGLEF